MDTFEISATIDGELVSLRVSYLGNFPDPKYKYYKICHGDEVLSIVRIDGNCEIEIDSGEIDQEYFPVLCREIKKLSSL